jgi:uroporphyrinogen decarboxylase
LHDLCKENNVIVRQHSDSHTEELFEDLVEIGLDILNPLQPECNDLEKVRQKVGRKLAFHGAVGSRLLDRGKPEEIRETSSCE